MIADLVILGRIATLGGDSGYGWAHGLAIADGRITTVGSRDELGSVIGPATEVIELPPDQMAMPGITDAHLHLMTLVIAELQVDLTGMGLDAALEAIGRRHGEMLAAGDSEGWLLGHGWSLDDLGEWPTVAHLERAAPGRAVALYAHDHHARWVSTRALQLAGIDAGATNPGGGLIRRDDQGIATGILHETASSLVDVAIPVRTHDELTDALHRVCARLAALGLTGCHDPGELGSDEGIDRGPVFYRALAEANQLPLRIHSSIRALQIRRAAELGLTSGLEAGDGRFRMGWLKLFADGSLGSRSAALLAPYDDAATNPPTGGPTGMVLTDAEELAELVNAAADVGIVSQIHAIGDGAVRTVLDVFERSSAVRGNPPLMRRIEHAQLVDPADTPRFGKLNVAASSQPVHLRSDATPARVAWGARAENTFPLRSLIDGGALIPLGTDAPVEPPDPWPGIAVAVARREPLDESQQLTGAHNAIALDRAIRAACLDPALAAGLPDVGRLMPGYRADLLIVPASPFLESFDAADVACIRPIEVFLDGQRLGVASN